MRSPQCNLRPDWLILSELEVRNAFFGARLGRPLSRDQGKLSLRVFEALFRVARLCRDASIDDHLLDSRNLIQVLITKSLAQSRHYSFFVFFKQFGFHRSLRFGLLCPFSRLFLHNPYIRYMDRPFPIDYSAVWMVLRFPDRLFNNANAFDQYLFFLRQNLKDLSSRATMVTGHYLDIV